MKKKKSNEKVVEEALIKKALGYDAEEITEEYVFDKDTMQQILSKKKVLIKHFPPDVSAIKILLSYYGNKTFDELEGLTNEELLVERDKLLEQLKAENLKFEGD